jgi:hypothetical protein
MTISAIPDDELIELAFDALVPFANMAEVTESIELQDLRQARNVLRLLSERLSVAKKINANKLSTPC